MKNRILRIVLPSMAIAILLTGAVVYFSSAANAGKARATSAAAGLTKLQEKLLMAWHPPSSIPQAQQQLGRALSTTSPTSQTISVA